MPTPIPRQYLVEQDELSNLNFVFPINLDGYDTIDLHMKRPDGTVIVKEAVIDSAANGIFHFEWEDGDLQAGLSIAEIRFTDTDGNELTLPPDNPIHISCRKRVG